MSIENVGIIVLSVLLLLNCISFVMYGYDKWQATRQNWRTPEKTLLSASFFGPIGALLGVILFRHKISKTSYLVKLTPLVVVGILFWGFLIARLVMQQN
jgi:uncharacterized membrane protein YsdA (DUF1294 family)